MRNRPRDHDCPKTFWAIAGDARVEIQAAEGAEPKRPTFTMNAYNGGALNVATYPYPVVVDLDGLKASSRITVLMGHDYAQVVGQGKATITAGAVTITGAMTGDLDAEPALSILTHAKNGFVWPVSIGASVDRLEFVKEGKTAIVNAQSFTGPLYIARKGRLREVSFVGVGADEDAQARIAAQAANGGLSSREEQDMEFREMYKKITGKRSVLEAAGKSADDLLARAEAEDWTGERLDAELARIDELVNLRGSRPTAPGIMGGASDRPEGPEVLEAALLMHTGYGYVAEKRHSARVCQAAADVRATHAMDIVRYGLRRQGRSIPGEPGAQIEAGFSTSDLF